MCLNVSNILMKHIDTWAFRKDGSADQIIFTITKLDSTNGSASCPYVIHVFQVKMKLSSFNCEKTLVSICHNTLLDIICAICYTRFLAH